MPFTFCFVLTSVTWNYKSYMYELLCNIFLSNLLMFCVKNQVKIALVAVIVSLKSLSFQGIRPWTPPGAYSAPWTPAAQGLILLFKVLLRSFTKAMLPDSQRGQSAVTNITVQNFRIKSYFRAITLGTKLTSMHIVSSPHVCLLINLQNTLLSNVTNGFRLTVVLL